VLDVAVVVLVYCSREEPRWPPAQLRVERGAGRPCGAKKKTAARSEEAIRLLRGAGRRQGDAWGKSATARARGEEASGVGGSAVSRARVEGKESVPGRVSP